jgi:hypothetical protein
MLVKRRDKALVDGKNPCTTRKTPERSLNFEGTGKRLRTN